MESFDLVIDRKVSMWMREHHTVEAETKEAAVEILRKCLEDKGDTYALESSDDHYETLLETEELLTPQENSGQSTIEICEAPEYGVLWCNADPS